MELESVLQVLFNLYDQDGSGNISLQEFVDANKSLAAGDDNDFVGEWFELTVRGELEFAIFQEWQAERLAETCSGHREMVQEVERSIDAIRRARRKSEHAAGTGSAAARNIRGADGMASKRDADIRDLAGKLRDLRMRRRAAQGAISDEEKVMAARLKQLLEERRKALKGKLIIKGSVNSKCRPLENAEVSLQEKSICSATARSLEDGTFTVKAEAVELGIQKVVNVKLPGYADASKRVGGEGVRNVRFELLPLTVCEVFEARPGRNERKTYVDPKSGTRFDVPIGHIMKNGEPFAGRVEFHAGVVDVTSVSGLQTMPPLTGRSVNGSCRPMQSMGCVYVDMKDNEDGSDLSLAPESSGIGVTFDCKVPLSKQPPAVWHYNAELGEWEETLQPLVVNGSELRMPDPDDASEPTPIESKAQDAVEKQQEEDLQAGRKELDAQRKEAGEEKVCTCGFEAKKAIMPLVNKMPGLEASDPPKRIFATTEKADDASGKIQALFEYLTDEQCRKGADLASQHKEVILSHHLVNVSDVLGAPSSAASAAHHRGSGFYKTAARKALNDLAVIAGWLEEHAKLLDEEGGEPTGDAADNPDQGLIKLKVLELLAGFWAKASYDYETWTAGPTLHEVCNALYDSSENVGEALLLLAGQQARRYEIKEVRRRLREEDKYLVATHSIVDKALEETDGDIERAVAIVRGHDAVKKHQKKFSVREELNKVMPMAHPKSAQLERALEESGGDVTRAAAILEGDPVVQEQAQEVYKEWKEILEEANETNNLDMQIMDTGWNNVDAWREEEREVEPRVEPDHEVYEFYPPRPRPVCPVGDSSMVMGLFDEGVGATRATALGVTWVGVDYSEDVQPDGSFNLISMGSSTFELRTTKADGTESFSYGPFRASRAGEVTYLGLLEPRRDDGVRWEHLARNLEIVLPPLEFPPHGRRSKPKREEWAEEYEDGEYDADEPPRRPPPGDWEGTWKLEARIFVTKDKTIMEPESSIAECHYHALAEKISIVWNGRVFVLYRCEMEGEEGEVLRETDSDDMLTLFHDTDGDFEFYFRRCVYLPDEGCYRPNDGKYSGEAIWQEDRILCEARGVEQVTEVTYVFRRRREGGERCTCFGARDDEDGADFDEGEEGMDWF